MRTSTPNSLAKLERTLRPIRTPSAGSEACRSGSIFPAFASSTLAGTTPRVRHWSPSWTMPGVSLKKECWRVTGADQPPMPLLKYSSRAQKSACRRVSILTTRMGIGGKKFDCVGGIKTQQRFERPPLGWTGERMKYRTPVSRTDYRYHERKPVFFGHYWLKDRPEITAPNAACLDFSVAKEGYLTAYRWSGESELAESSLVSVPA